MSETLLYRGNVDGMEAEVAAVKDDDGKVTLTATLPRIVSASAPEGQAPTVEATFCQAYVFELQEGDQHVLCVGDGHKQFWLNRVETLPIAGRRLAYTCSRCPSDDCSCAALNPENVGR